MKKICLIVVTLGLLLGGCVFQQLESGLNKMTGEDISYAVRIWGYPNAKREMFGKTIYIWSTQSSGSMVLPTTTYQPGTTSTTYGTVGNTTYSGTTYTSGQTVTTYQTYNYNYNCTIELIVNSQGIIESWQYNGNAGGCGRFTRNLPQ